MTFWRITGVLYIIGVALVVRDKFRKREATQSMPDSIEDQLDIAIHTREIEEAAHGSH